MQAQQTEVAFPVTEAVLDLHALAIGLYDLVGRQPSFRVRRHQREPGLFEPLLSVDDDIDGFGLLAMVEDVAIAGGTTAAVGQTSQTQALPAAPS